MTTIPSAMGVHVEQRTMPGYSTATDMTRRIGVMHTGEVPPTALDGLMDGFAKNEYAPTFCVGQGRIVQTRPLGVMCGTLAHNPEVGQTNGWAAVQIEVAGYSSEQPWLPGTATFGALAALLAELAKRDIVPLARPFVGEWTLANAGAHENTRRTSGAWANRAGWWAHAEVPYQATKWHWDPGNLRWDSLIAAAGDLLRPAPARARYYLVGRGQPGDVKITAVAKAGGGRGVALYARSVLAGARLAKLTNDESAKAPGRVSYRRTMPRGTPPRVGDPFD